MNRTTILNHSYWFGFLFMMLSFTLSSSLKAQSDYIPMLELNREWTVVKISYDIFPVVDSSAVLTKSRIISDTIIDSKQYWVLQREIGPNLLREDTLTQQVFFRYPVLDPSFHYVDTLLYDFSWQLGDTVEMWVDSYIDDKIISVIGVDSLMVDATFRKRLTLKIHGIKDSIFRIVEGIGRDRNFNIMLNVWDSETMFNGIIDRMVCMKQDTQLIWSNLQYWYTCDSILIEFPNAIEPTIDDTGGFQATYLGNGDIQIQIGQHISLPLKISIFNTSGVLIRKEILTVSTQIINLANQPKGVYIIQLNGPRWHQSKKIVTW